jgi:hypothetical protein
VTALPACSHVYHSECVSQWLGINKVRSRGGSEGEGAQRRPAKSCWLLPCRCALSATQRSSLSSRLHERPHQSVAQRLQLTLHLGISKTVA